MKNPEISVVMSVYNGARYLRKAVESILLQEGVDFEFIIINDGSTDETGGILEDYRVKDHRIRIINQENQGLTKALILGCREARGEFIARQDSDDLSMKGRLLKLAEMLRNDSSLSFVSSWGEVIGPEDEPLLLYKRPENPDMATHQLLYESTGPPGHGSVMFRRSSYDKVGGYRPQFYYAQDSDLWLRMGMIGKISYYQEVLYQYRISEESISGGLHYAKIPYANLIDELHAARLAGEREEPILAKAPSLEEVKKNSSNSSSFSEDMTLYFIGKCLYERHDRRAVKYLSKCIKMNPLKLKAWAFLLASYLKNFKKQQAG